MQSLSISVTVVDTFISSLKEEPVSNLKFTPAEASLRRRMKTSTISHNGCLKKCMGKLLHYFERVVNWAYYF